MSFEAAFQKVVGVEGVYSNDPNDPGGETKWGITKRVATANGYIGDMKAMPLTMAKSIYKRQFWDTLRLDDVDASSPAVANELFDTSVNIGTGRAGMFLQRALTGLNQQATDYPDLTVDGVVGPMTVQALRIFLAKRGAQGELVMLRLLNGQQATYYLTVEENRPTSERYLYGWILQRVT